MGILVSIVILDETVPIRIGDRGPRLKDAFVEDELIVFVGGLGMKFVLFGFADDFTCLMNARFPRCPQWMLEFVQGVLTQHLIIELRHSLHIERVSLDFTFRFIIVASVSIVFKPTRTKFRNVLTGFKFVGELTEMGAEGDVRLIRTMHIEDGIRVVIEDLFPEELQGFVQP